MLPLVLLFYRRWSMDEREKLGNQPDESQHAAKEYQTEMSETEEMLKRDRERQRRRRREGCREKKN